MESYNVVYCMCVYLLFVTCTCDYLNLQILLYVIFFVKLSLLCNEMKYFILNSFELEIDYYFNFSLHFNITGQCIAMLYLSVPIHHASNENCNYKSVSYACLVKIKLNK